MITTLKNSCLVFLLGLLLVSCNDEARYFEQSTDIENSNWKREFTPEFTFEITDTSKVYHLIYTIRNGKNYPYYNLYIESELISESGLIVGTFFKEIYLFDANTGKPNGNTSNIINSALGDVYDGRYLCKSYYKFPQTGKYTFTTKQYMRDEANLKDIIAVGLRIENVVAK